MTGFIWQGSTGARAVEHLRKCAPGTVIESPTFAVILKVDPRALHQLLENALQLRLLRKVRIEGKTCVGWTLGAARIGATIEQRTERRAANDPPRPPRRERRRTPTDPANAPRRPFVTIAWQPLWTSWHASADTKPPARKRRRS